MGANEKILDFVKQKGPVIPAEIARHLNVNNLFASALLAELVDRGGLHLTHVKVGGSPVYYLEGQEDRLQEFSKYLPEKEQRACKMLRESKVLSDAELEPLYRVALRQIKDYAKPFEVSIGEDKHIFWKWYMLPNSEAEEIIKQFKKITFIAPRTDGLIPVGEERIQKSLQSIVNPEFLNVVTRKPSVYSGGFPFQIEVGIAYGGDAGRVAEANEEGVSQRKIEIMRFANRAPLLFDTGGCAITKAVQSIDWKRYGMKDFENAPLTIFVNLISVHIPYTSAGKQAISDEDEIMEELRLALMDTGRRIYTFIGRQRRLAEKEAKRKMFYKYATEVAYAVSELTGKTKKDIEQKLHSIVLKHLKLEEQKEKEMDQKSEMSEEEIEKEYEKRKAREKKDSEKKQKKKGISGGDE